MGSAPAVESAIHERLVALVAIVFAVVVAQSFVLYSDEIVHPRLNLTVVALGAVYVTVVSSWMGYHRSVATFKYSEGWKSTLRFSSDLVIVLLYAYLLFSIDEITKSRNLVRYISGFPVIFLFYIVSGAIRILEHGAEASRQRALWVFAAILAGTAGLYHGLYSNDIGTADQLNWIFVGIPPGVILFWRLAGRKLI